MELAELRDRASRILDEVERAVVGKRDALELVLLGVRLQLLDHLLGSVSVEDGKSYCTWSQRHLLLRTGCDCYKGN